VAGLQIANLICNPGILRQEKLQFSSKEVERKLEKSLKEFGHQLDFNYSSSNKVF